VEIANDQYRLKPGMYARVGIVTDSHPNALVVPTKAVVDASGTRGVYLSVNNVAQFHPVKIGIEGNERTEILDGVSEGDRVVTTGAAGLRNGDPIILAGGGEGGRGRGGRGRASQGAEGARGSVGSGGSAGSGGSGSGFQGSRAEGSGFGGRGGNAAATDPGSRIPDPASAGREGRGRFGGRRGGQQQ
jgi:hypothetical protein